MAREFPETLSYSSAFGFALEVERACADMAAAAGVLAPNDAWQTKLEELVCGHDDRVEKLSSRRSVGPEPAMQIDGRNYLSTLSAEPETAWPEAAEQLALAEEDAGRYHEDFARVYHEALGGDAHLFDKAAKQARAAAASLRAMLDD